MHYTTLEKLGIKVSKLGFGAMRLPCHEDGTIHQEAVNEMVALAIENGVNYFDTSIIYHNGMSEVSLGKALKPYPRSSYYLADKMSFWDVKTPEQLDSFFQGSLDRLGMDYIDFYLMHSLTKELWKKIKKLDAINWALQKQKEGKIKFLGFSIHDDATLLTEVLDAYDWDFAQIQYNYLDEFSEPGKAGYLELVKRQIPIMIMEPLKGGILATIPEHICKPFKAFNGSCASFSFRWLADQTGIATILSGMTYLPHVEDNIHTFNHLTPLSSAEHKAIETVKDNILQSQKVACTGCKYCLPCPLGIPIPTLFAAWNLQSMNQTGNWVSGEYLDYKSAEKCITCNKCMTKCPQHIQIPTKLKELVATK